MLRGKSGNSCVSIGFALVESCDAKIADSRGELEKSNPKRARAERNKEAYRKRQLKTDVSQTCLDRNRRDS